MTGLDVLLAVAGLIATLLVVVGMILITPRGAVDDGTDPQGEELSRAEATGPGVARSSQWREQDSNLRRLSQRIYSPSPLTARESRPERPKL